MCVKGEELTGPNQYHCGRCQSKQDAQRFIELRSLPDCLTFQLLRFVYDTTTWTKKKLTHNVQCPVELDMSTYLGLPPGHLILAAEDSIQVS